MSDRFTFVETPLSGLFHVERKPIRDERGYLTRFFCAYEFANVGFDSAIAQINHTYTKQKGAVRGMHFQYSPHAEMKLVSCIRGEIFDVAVDIRRDSKTFMQWYGAILCSEKQNALLIPEGFAHGFQALRDDCEMIYLHSDFHEPSAEGGLNISDPRLDIDWPLQITSISDKDNGYKNINDEFMGIDVR